LNEKIAKERLRRETFGDVRPSIHLDFKGKKILAVGSRIYYSDHWKSFFDFLSDYVPLLFGKEWGEKELAKPEPERHVIVRFRTATLRYIKSNERPENRDEHGMFTLAANGSAMAYVTLAYHLYLLEHHQRLQARIVRRLKDPASFQGARYELFATAACISAGFTIEHEDESDGTRKPRSSSPRIGRAG
jgi:hypothetical protein